MTGVDLARYDFDYDLTFAALLMHADGTIYHTFAGRDMRGPESQLDRAAIVAVLDETFKEHRGYSKAPRPPRRTPRPNVEVMGRELDPRQKQPDCHHCHTINDYVTRLGQRDKTWTVDKAWQWPDPIQAGLTIREKSQRVVEAVEKGSAAAVAGIRPGDRIVNLGRQGVLTFGDIQRALHEAPAGTTSVPIVVERGDKHVLTKLRLAAGWKTPTPEVFAWRASKWPLSPKPGFGGKALTKGQLRRYRLPEDSFAFKVGYIVDWGHNAHTGRNAARAGLRRGDIVTAVAGRSTFNDMHHFHAWFRLTRKAGEVIDVDIIRNGKKRKLELRVVD